MSVGSLPAWISFNTFSLSSPILKFTLINCSIHIIYELARAVWLTMLPLACIYSWKSFDYYFFRVFNAAIFFFVYELWLSLNFLCYFSFININSMQLWSRLLSYKNNFSCGFHSICWRKIIIIKKIDVMKRYKKAKLI